MSSQKTLPLSRRQLLKAFGVAPLIFRPAPFYGSALFGPLSTDPHADFPLTDFRLTPRYPAKSPLADVLRLVEPGLDEFITEKYAAEIDLLLKSWGRSMTGPKGTPDAIAKLLAPHFQGSALTATKEIELRSGSQINVKKRHFDARLVAGTDHFLTEMRAWIGPGTTVEIAEFEITSIEEIANDPLTLRLEIRYDIVANPKTEAPAKREERVGSWRTEWLQHADGSWKAQRWEASDEVLTSASGPGFLDITAQAMAGAKSYGEQLLRGTDYWRTVLDSACGIDVYGNNGVAIGDFDGDGFDDFYVCQPAGLPNRLYRNRGDGTFEDVTEKAGVAVLDGTACALFADFENRGRQDLLVVCGSGPLLFANQGDGTFVIRKDAFKFARVPEGTFTHAAIADYDLDGRLDIYFCTYSYYLGLDQYHYPVPYYDARNGPANFLMHNEGDGTFVDRTEASGLNVDNDRYSFACAWGDAESKGWPDLYVANDFGRANLYRNDGTGKFTTAASKSHVEDPGAGMSAAWSDFDNDGRPDIYIANMWSSAGQRVSQQKIFHERAQEEIRGHYRRHAHGNWLYRNLGNGEFQNVSAQSGVEMGRWSWCSDFLDFDQDGYPDLYVANGYISAPQNAESNHSDLGSFFWRQVVGRSPEDSTPSLAYEHGWNALNELIRSDRSWSGHERNVLFANNRDGSFSEVSGAVGLDFPEDGRSFALADLDHDGRLEIILKNRNAPQLRILRNSMRNLGDSIVFRLRGTKSNRDAIGAAVTVETGPLRQTRYIQAGSGFLAQHSKELFFGIGKQSATTPAPINATIRWPSGVIQTFQNLPTNHRIEIEEGSPAFTAKAFAPSPGNFAHQNHPTTSEDLPDQVETWLLEPLKAPQFSLPDTSGVMRELKSFRGKFVLLTFWAIKSAQSCEQLMLLQRQRAAIASVELDIIAINVDQPSDAEAAKSFSLGERFAFPVLLANEEIAGIYNILYRYLYDRRRDMPIPTSFLLDPDGMIVKLYQGPFAIAQLDKDIKTMPATASDRVRRAIPFPGELYHGSFQRNDFTYGVALFQHGYLAQAAESFEQVVATKPNDPEAYYNLGTLNLRRNNYPEAQRYLEQTLKLRPDYPEAWNNLGMMAAQQGRAQEAIDNFQKSLSLRPDYEIALLNLGNILRRQGAFDKAYESLNRAFQIQPDDPEINYSLGMLYAQQDKMQSAEEYLQKALVLRPDYPEALNNLGIVYVRQKDFARAEQQFSRAIDVSPNFDQSYINLARLYAMRGDKPKARQALQQLLQLQPRNAAAQKAMEVMQ